MPNDVNETPPNKGPGDEAYKKLAEEKGIPLDEKLYPKAEAFFRQLKETVAHAATPDELEAMRTQTMAPDFDPTMPGPKLSTGDTPPNIPPKQPPPPGGGSGGNESSGENPLLILLMDLFRDKFFVSVLIGLAFMTLAHFAMYYINTYNNSPEVMERQEKNLKAMERMQKLQDTADSRSIFSSFSATSQETLNPRCVVTVQDRLGNNRSARPGCTRLKYEYLQNDPGMSFNFGEGWRISSIEGKYRLQNGREVLCQTNNPAEEKFSTDGCAQALANKQLVSMGVYPLHQDGIIVSYIKP